MRNLQPKAQFHSRIPNSVGSPKQTIAMDDDIICDACKFAELKRDIDWERREEQLLSLLELTVKRNKIRRNCSRSGGKDSAYTSHKLKHKYGMNPLTVTWSPHLYTDIGRENFDNWNHLGGCDNVLFTPNGGLIAS